MTSAGPVAAPVVGDCITQNPPATCALAIDIGGTKSVFALASSNGDILKQFRVETPLPKTAPADALVWFTEQIRLAQLAFGATKIQSCVVVRPGIVDDDSAVSLSPNTPALNDRAIATAVHSVLGKLPVSFENDVRAAAYAEVHLGHLRDADPGLYVNLGTGIAAVLTVGGVIVRGAHNMAGEIGYVSPHAGMLFSPDISQDLAPLEQLIGGPALTRYAQREFGRDAQARELFLANTPRAKALVYEMAIVLGNTLGNLCTLVDPRRIVFGGGMIGSFETWSPIVETYLQNSLPAAPELMVSAHHCDGSIVGAALLCPITDPNRTSQNHAKYQEES